METVFTSLFGSSPQMRVIDFMLIHDRFDYSLTEIARNSNVGWTTINRFWKEWRKKGFVKKTRRIGRAQLYCLNKENKNISRLAELHENALKEFLDEEIAKQKQKAPTAASSGKKSAGATAYS